MKIVVDTNIVFSGILNSSHTIGRLLLTPKTHFKFYSCDFLSEELLKHRNKLLKLTKISDEELTEIEKLVTQNITFINEALIPKKVLLFTEKLMTNIDINDSPFVALAMHLDAKLWTGDKELLKGLKIKRFRNVITTSELFDLFDRFENK